MNSSDHGEPPKGMTLKQHAYQEIKDAILSRVVSGGDELEEVSLARKLGVSRTPVREALRVLETEGLVTITPGKGAFVSSPSWKDLNEIFVMRETLEALAARLAAHGMDADHLQQLDGILASSHERLEAHDYEAMLDLDAEFHGTINGYCGNAKLTEIIIMLTNQAKLNECKVSAWRAPGFLEQSLREHEALLAAIRAHDGDVAERLMREHGHRFVVEATRYWGSLAR